MLNRTWVYVVVHDYIWEYMGMPGSTWIHLEYMSLHVRGNRWIYTVIHGYSWKYLVKNGCTWLHVAIHCYTRQNTDIDGYLVNRLVMSAADSKK